jgi:multiple sugar transport system substrate-binding protein
MKKCKLLSTLLVVTVAASIVAGCGSAKSGNKSADNASSSLAESAAASVSLPTAADTEASAESTAETGKNTKEEAIGMGVPEEYAQDLADEGLPADYFNINGKKPNEITGNILYWSWDPNFFDMVKKMNDVYPNVTFECVSVSSADEYLQKLQAALTSGGKVPDILAMEINSVGTFYDMDICDDLSKYGVDKNLLIKYTADFGTNNDGVFVGIPNTAAPGGLYYRRDLAKQYLGTDDPDKITAMIDTWDKFIEVGKQVKEKSGGKVSMIPGVDSFVQPLINQSGLRWRDDNKLMISEKFVPVIETMKKIDDAGIDDGLDIWSSAYNASFAQGSVLCYPGSCWFQSYVLEPNDPKGSGNWGVATLPGGVYNWGGIWWGMYNQSENKDAVAAYMKYELTRQGARNKYDLIHFYPGVKSVYEDDYMNKPNEYFGGQNVTQLYLKEMNEMTVLRPIVSDGTLWEV